MDGDKHVQWLFIQTGNRVSDTESNGSTGDKNSILSSSISSNIDVDDDATSSSTSSYSGPLFVLSELMDHLPIKRGLSNFFQGKSESFTSLASVKSLEDLAKKESPYKRRVKPCNKYRPKGIIKKKYSCSSERSNFVFVCR